MRASQNWIVGLRCCAAESGAALEARRQKVGKKQQLTGNAQREAASRSITRITQQMLQIG
jgi:hypothetical protein